MKMKDVFLKAISTPKGKHSCGLILIGLTISTLASIFLKTLSFGFWVSIIGVLMCFAGTSLFSQVIYAIYEDDNGGE